MLFVMDVDYGGGTEAAWALDPRDVDRATEDAPAFHDT
jgi:hypothetical protein